MAFEYFSKNGEILLARDAVVSLSNIEYAYGFGVYETIRAAHGKALFIDDHLARLMESARILGLEHPFVPESIKESILELIAKNSVDACNIKLLLIGAPTKEEAMLSIQCLNPLFPDKKLYRDGCDVITYTYERIFPHAKSLNMLESYRAYKKAKEAGAYDALLVNRKGCVTEGTRTNFFCIRAKTLYSPPEEGILLGVTRDHVLSVAENNGYAVQTTNIALEDVASYDGAFITSTSTKIMPIRAIDGKMLSPIPETLKELMHLYDSFLEMI
jgi:branched-subunit amino acid aminotransferase/4-amino-4-deoxychorismate lyase